MQLVNLKCPNCGAKSDFKFNSVYDNTVTCGFCGSEFSVKEVGNTKMHNKNLPHNIRIGKPSLGPAVGGWFLIFMGSVWLSLIVSDINSVKGEVFAMIPMTAAALGFGGALLWKYYILKGRFSRFHIYQSIVLEHKIRYLNEISEIIGKPYDVVLKDLQYMVENRYIANAYINLKKREIIVK
jgi:hypothetical protein